MHFAVNRHYLLSCANWHAKLCFPTAQLMLAILYQNPLTRASCSIVPIMADGSATRETIDVATAESSSASKRRKVERGDHPRKRLRYVAEACNQCKRQKVRCNGRKPCNHCEKLRPRECYYQGRQHECNCPEYVGNKGNVTPADQHGEIVNAPDGGSLSNLP